MQSRVNVGLGDDILRGGKGSDSIKGNKGGDRLFGDAGQDIFVLESNLERNIIKDFTDGVDSLGLTAGIAFEDLSITNNALGTSTLIRDLNNGNELLAIVQNVAATELSFDDFVDI